MRKVKVFGYQHDEKTQKHNRVYARSGLFHGVGVTFQEFEYGVGNYSTAIVEFPDGTIDTPPIEMIEFEDKLN